MYAVVIVVGLDLEGRMRLPKLDDYTRYVTIRKHGAGILGSFVPALVCRFICFLLPFDPAVGGDRDGLGQIGICAKALLGMLKCVLYLRKLPTILERIKASLRREYALGV